MKTMESKATRKTWVFDADGNLIELAPGDPVPDGCSIHVRFNDSAGRANAYIRDARGRAYLDYVDRLTRGRKETARNVRAGRPDPWQWYVDWQREHGNL